ncbi:hypothetical protein [Mesorhizobium sp. NZP2234]|uniref:hypothetical protein n=1 Tax=Mesorhizobium sp. NZP2234 TaxID=2483402 RepID=UPI001FEEC12F|nr:hypothetical protein [Mesorhizobium sp. NZP2234]
MQLIDASSAVHIWGEHYDRELDNIFAIQDDITRMIAARLARQARTAIASRPMRTDAPVRARRLATGHPLLANRDLTQKKVGIESMEVAHLPSISSTQAGEMEVGREKGVGKSKPGSVGSGSLCGGFPRRCLRRAAAAA